MGFTALGCNFICTLKVAFYLKALNPELPILLGGPHATILDVQILRSYPQFDVVVRGESDPYCFLFLPRYQVEIFGLWLA